jgi:glycosyltransferase involved in cell wall biosynthesis
VAEDAAAVTVVSESDETRLKGIGVTRFIDVMPVPIDLAILPKSAGGNPDSLVAVGRFVPKKGFDVALKALALLPETYTLSVIGDGMLRGHLEALAESLNISDRVRWYGMLSLESTLEIVARSGVVLHPSRVAEDGNADGTPQMILWAQAMGIPVISTPTGAIPDIVSNDVTGMLIEPDDPRELENAILRLRNDGLRRSRIIAQAQRAVIEGHSLARITSKWQDIYRRTASPLNN